MLETRATVIRLEGAEAIVEAEPGRGCGSCGGSKGCGSSKLSQALCVRPRQFRVRNCVDARVGDRVLVGIADGLLLRSALTLYGLPILLLLGGAALGAYLMDGAAGRDAGAAMGAAAGLVAGFVLARLIASRERAGAPVILRCESATTPAIP